MFFEEEKDKEEDKEKEKEEEDNEDNDGDDDDDDDINNLTTRKQYNRQMKNNVRQNSIITNNCPTTTTKNLRVKMNAPLVILVC